MQNQLSMQGNDEILKTILSFARTNTHSGIYADVPSPESLTLPRDLARIPPIDTAWLRVRAERLSHYPESEVRYLASEFDPARHNELFLIPQRVDYVWQTVAEEIRANGVEVAILAVPLFWQIGPMFYYTCRALGVPISVVSPRNIPLAQQVIADVGVDMIVTTPEGAEALAAGLSEKALLHQIKVWHLIVPAGFNGTIPVLSRIVSLEYHLFPGVPIEYAPKPGASPAALPEFRIEETRGRRYATNLVPHALPLIRYAIPDGTHI